MAAYKEEQMRSPKKPKAPNLGPGEPKRISNKPLSAKAMEKPSEALARRQKETEKKKPLSESLTEAAAVIPPGTGTAGRALSSAISGSAAGATIGEAIAKLMEEKKQRGKKKPTTIAQKATSASKPAQPE